MVSHQAPTSKAITFINKTVTMRQSTKLFDVTTKEFSKKPRLWRNLKLKSKKAISNLDDEFKWVQFITGILWCIWGRFMNSLVYFTVSTSLQEANFTTHFSSLTRNIDKLDFQEEAKRLYFTIENQEIWLKQCDSVLEAEEHQNEFVVKLKGTSLLNKYDTNCFCILNITNSGTVSKAN